MSVLAPCSIGEIFDKITILEIKEKKIRDQKKLSNIKKELHLLKDLVNNINAQVKLVNTVNELRLVNEQLWVIEDELRILEKSEQFDEKFIQLARSVYITNDKRSAIKKQINVLTGSMIIEEKSYDYL